MIPWIAIAAQLASSAPALAAALKSKDPGKVAQAAVHIAASLDTKPTPDAIQTALAADPAALDKIVAAQATWDAADQADRADARAAFKASPMPAVVFYVTSLMVVAFLAAIVFLGRQFDGAQWDAMKLYGPLIFAAWGGAGAYFVGSSLGSRSKEQIISRSAK